MNNFEEKAKKALEEKGWEVIKGGWPDFLCVREKNGKKEVMGVEVKSKNDKFRGNQKRNLLLLSKVMRVRELREGSGFGDELNRNDMCLLIVRNNREEE